MPEHARTNTQLRFITSTSLAKNDSTSQYIVRSHAGKHGKNPHIKSSSLLAEGVGSPAPDYQTAKKAYTSRLKLQTWVRKSGRQRKILPYPDKITKEIGVEKRRKRSSTPLSNRFKPSLFDHHLLPANPLPIPFFQGTGEILSYYFGLSTNSFALNPDGDFFDSIRGDASALHALLSVVGRLRHLQTGAKNNGITSIHQAEAVRLINEHLAEDIGDLSDGLIAAVAILVNQEVLGDSLDRATVHLNGLVKMIEVRGGLDSIESNMVLKRVITYADFCFSSTWGQPLHFPFVRVITERLGERNHLTPSLPQLHPLQNGVPVCFAVDYEVLDAIDLLLLISASIASSPNSSHERNKISDLIYLADYRLCELNSNSIDPINSTTIDLSVPLGAAAHLFLVLGIRDIPSSARRHRRLFDKLHASLLQQPNWTTIPVIPQHLVAPLLWMSAIAAADEGDMMTRRVHLTNIEDYCLLLGVAEYVDFEAVLKQFLWIDPFCGYLAKSLWMDIETGIMSSESTAGRSGII